LIEEVYLPEQLLPKQTWQAKQCNKIIEIFKPGSNEALQKFFWYYRQNLYVKIEIDGKFGDGRAKCVTLECKS